MDREQLYNAIDTLKEKLGTEEFLDELITALNNDELSENLDHIAQIFDIDIS